MTQISKREQENLLYKIYKKPHYLWISYQIPFKARVRSLVTDNFDFRKKLNNLMYSFWIKFTEKNQITWSDVGESRSLFPSS